MNNLKFKIITKNSYKNKLYQINSIEASIKTINNNNIIKYF